METTRIDQIGQRSWAVVTESGSTISTLLLFPNGEVEWIGTVPRYRRQGHARRLWEHAKASGFNPRHSSVRSPEGTAWAKAVGGHVPTLTMGA